jgi:UDP-N-acetylmuramate--alanine ligase
MKYKLAEIHELLDIQKIFFVGIKGVGMTPLAIIAREAGYKIVGSDIQKEFITDRALREKEITVINGFEVEAVQDFFKETDIKNCLVITTGAHKGFNNPQVVWCRERGITILTQGQALALFMQGEMLGKKDMEAISVAGSHGKTTISSLLATTLKALGLEPSYSVGTGEVFPLGAPGHLGSGNYFIAEADEYASEPVSDRVPKFLYQKPKFAIFNNIDFDHPDLFNNTEEIAEAFVEFAHNIKSDGKLFINGDDKYLLEIKENIYKDITIVTYGSNANNYYRISKIVTHAFSSRFTVTRGGKELGVFELSVPGIHNAKNALSVIALLTELGFEAEKIRVSLRIFTGTKRRLEIVGATNGGALLIDDYGHHPLEIMTTIEALREAYPTKKIVCIFQPHTYSRTKALLQEFGGSFNRADQLLLLPIFKSARDTEKDILSEDEYRNAFKEKSDTQFFETFESVVEYVKKNCASSEFVVLTIGAGDVYEIAWMLKDS